jgi:hypothetical protein
MKTPSFALALAVAAALTAPAARDVQAAYTGIQKCRAADGGVVYTDKPCDAFGARPEAMSTDLGVRLSSESMQAAEAGLDMDMEGAVVPSAQGAPTGRRSLAAGCARTPTQLAMDVQASIGLRDVNRLAESYHWVGMSHEQAMPVMRQLEALTRTQVLGSQVHSMSMGLQFADASGEMMEPQAGTLLVSLHADEGPRTVQLNVQQYAGCYFARF